MWFVGVQCVFLCLFVCAGVVVSHSSNGDAIREISDEIEQLKQHISLAPTMIDYLRQGIEAQLQQLANQVQTTKSPEELAEEERNARLVAEVMERIDALQENVMLLEKYIEDESNTDAYLRALDGATGQTFQGVLGTVRALADGMRRELQADLQPVDVKLGKVFATANERNVEVGGILYMGRVGSACAGSVDTCRTPGSECRDGKCQCVTGLSSDALNQACLEVCPNGYGHTYQTVRNYAIRGYNRLTMENVTLQACKDRCGSEASFACRSFDYFPDWNTCFLSDVIKGDVVSASKANPATTSSPNYGDYGDGDGDNDKAVVDVVTEKPDGWEFNSASIYFQRDCVVDRN